jgi:hypothetical protein
MSTAVAYCPEKNRAVERFNSTLQEILAWIYRLVNLTNYGHYLKIFAETKTVCTTYHLYQIELRYRSFDQLYTMTVQRNSIFLSRYLRQFLDSKEGKKYLVYANHLKPVMYIRSKKEERQVEAEQSESENGLADQWSKPDFIKLNVRE